MLVLSFFGGMQTAFFVTLILPPPATGAFILVRLDRAGAGGTANTGITPIMEGVIRQIVGLDVVPDIGSLPIHQRADLDAFGLVEDEEFHIRSRLRLFAP